MAERAWWPRSVRARTTFLATIVSAVALVTGAVLLVVSLERSLTVSGDDVARTRAHDIAALAAEDALPIRLAGVGDEGMAQVVDADGRVLAATVNVSGRPAVSSFRPDGSEPVVRTFDAPDDTETERYRVWALTGQSPDGPVTVYVGTSLESVAEASRTLRTGLLLGLPVLVALLAGATWLITGRTLRPVEGIRAEVASISDEELTRRVPVPPTDDEVARLAVTMNQMLDRLEDGSRRQREFVADASHELQSPLTALRTQIEVALADPGSDWSGVARGLMADTDQIERLVRDLLFLARNGSGPDRRTSLVDLDDAVLEEAARVRATTRVTVDTSGVSAAPVRGDADELRRLVRNLLENAVRHASGTVRVGVGAGTSSVQIDVMDDGPGVPAADRDRVFDRFWTSDESRSRGSGSGLGLAIARAVAVGHGGTLEVVDGGGGHFRLTLPLDGATGSGGDRRG